MFRRQPLVGLLLLVAAGALADAGRDVELPGGTFRTALPASLDQDRVEVAAFRLDRLLVTNADFAAFVAAFPEWRRDRAPKLFADDGYLRQWRTPSEPGDLIANQPATHVSWFAANAYCEAQHKRLPTWYEWEAAAAASETEPDARESGEWRQRVLEASLRRATGELAPAGSARANVYGIFDMHGPVWEWVEDFNGMLVSADNRLQGDPERLRFCGAGAVALEQKEHYAVLLRIAMLSSLEASYTAPAVGFRCARDAEPAP